MGMSAERGVSRVLVRNTRTMYQRMSDTRSYFVVPRLRVWGEGHQRRREGSIQHDLHKPSHLPLQNNFSKCFSNGMVYNNAKLWTRHTNQHQKLVFFLIRDATVTLHSLIC